MNRSKYIFFILALAYFGIAVGSALSFFMLNSNILLALSFSSLIISIEEAIRNTIVLLKLRNEYNYMLMSVSDNIQHRIDNNDKPQVPIDLYNYRRTIEDLITAKRADHPVEYNNMLRFSLLCRFSDVLFCFAIASFIIIPFIKHEIGISHFSQQITIFAFSIMCLNIALSDCQAGIMSGKMTFEQDKLAVMEFAFPGFYSDYMFKLEHFKKESKQK